MESKHLLYLEVGRSTICSKFERTRQGEKAWKYPKIVEKIERLGSFVSMNVLRILSVTVHVLRVPCGVCSDACIVQPRIVRGLS